MSAPGWKVPSYCANAACVEVHLTPQQVQVRATGARHVVLSVSPAAWRAFIASLKEEPR